MLYSALKYSLTNTKMIMINLFAEKSKPSQKQKQKISAHTHTCK